MLTIHKNTRVQRQSKELRKNLMIDAKELRHVKEISGYSIVVWNNNFDASCAWTSSGLLPGVLVPDFTKQALTRQINRTDTLNIIKEGLS